MTTTQKEVKLMQKAEAALTRKKAQKILKKFNKLNHSHDNSSAP